jgi:hypothetical protein
MQDLQDQHMQELYEAQEEHNRALGKAQNRYADAIQASRDKLHKLMENRLHAWRGEPTPPPTIQVPVPSVEGTPSGSMTTALDPNRPMLDHAALNALLEANLHRENGSTEHAVDLDAMEAALKQQ